MGRGLLFDVENPYEASTKVTADAARTMAAQTKRQETKTKEKTTLGDVVNTGLALGLGVSMLKGMGGGSAMAQANAQTANVDKMIAAKSGTPVSAGGTAATAPVSITKISSGISGAAQKGLAGNIEKMFDSMVSTYDMFTMRGGGF